MAQHKPEDALYNHVSMALRDHELASLYVRSGWSQRKLAEVEGVSQSTIRRRLHFGRLMDDLKAAGDTESLEVFVKNRRGWRWEK